MELFKILANNTKPFSFSVKARKKRHLLFMSLIDNIQKPITILDIGGTENYWKHMDGILYNSEISITLLNLNLEKVTASNFKSIIGDATNLSNIKDKEYDIVFSNSVIEHINTTEKQKLMVKEIFRVGKSYFIQTPNLYFPVEPHFLFPLFQFLPRFIQIRLLLKYSLGWVTKCRDKQNAIEVIESIKLLSYSDMLKLFPEATIYFEKFLFFTKSFVAYSGFKKGNYVL